MTRTQANLLLTLAALIWGSAFVVQQIGTGNLGTISFTGARFLLGALVVLPFAVRQFRRVEKGERPFQRRDWFGLIVTGLVLCTAAVLQQHGILRTSVANAGFLTAVYVPLVPIIGLLFLRRRVHWSVWPASCGCLAGTYIMSGAQGLDFRLGDLWVLSSTLFWAVHVILVGIMAWRTRAPLVVATTQFLVCGLTGLVVGILVEQPTMTDFLGASLRHLLCRRVLGRPGLHPAGRGPAFHPGGRRRHHPQLGDRLRRSCRFHLSRRTIGRGQDCRGRPDPLQHPRRRAPANARKIAAVELIAGRKRPCIFPVIFLSDSTVRNREGHAAGRAFRCPDLFPPGRSPAREFSSIPL